MTWLTGRNKRPRNAENGSLEHEVDAQSVLPADNGDIAMSRQEEIEAIQQGDRAVICSSIAHPSNRNAP